MCWRSLAACGGKRLLPPDRLRGGLRGVERPDGALCCEERDRLRGRGRGLGARWLPSAGCRLLRGQGRLASGRAAIEQRAAAKVLRR